MPKPFKSRHMVVNYHWKPADKVKPSAEETNHWFAVSTPADLKVPRTIARWSGTDWHDVNGAVLASVTFFAYLPHTPEDLKAREASEPVPGPVPLSPSPEITSSGPPANLE